MEPYNPEEWYTGVEAAKRLSENSGRKIEPSYVRKMAENGWVKTLKLGARYSLYEKKTIDSYVVEPRGTKAGRAMKQRKATTAEEAA
jgi:hypothetical protein